VIVTDTQQYKNQFTDNNYAVPICWLDIPLFELNDLC